MHCIPPLLPVQNLNLVWVGQSAFDQFQFEKGQTPGVWSQVPLWVFSGEQIFLVKPLLCFRLISSFRFACFGCSPWIPAEKYGIGCEMQFVTFYREVV